MKHTYDKHNLGDYISKQLRMPHIYQPVMIKALLENGGQATTEEIAKSVVCNSVAQKFLEISVSGVCRYPHATNRDSNMKKPVFIYNNPNAACVFCCRTHNPHPDYRHEPIVTTRMTVDDKEHEVCINCHCDMIETSERTKKELTLILRERVTLSRLLNKAGLPKCRP